MMPAARICLLSACLAAPAGIAWCQTPDRYPECYASGVEAARKGALQAAIRCFEDCIALRPGDPASTRELAAARAGIEDSARAERVVAAASAALERGDWKSFEAGLGGLPRPGNAQAGSASGLLPVFAAYAAGDTVRALHLADSIPASGPRALSRRFTEALRARRRRAWFEEWVAPAAVAYGVLLLGGIFFGLRQAHRGRGNPA